MVFSSDGASQHAVLPLDISSLKGLLEFVRRAFKQQARSANVTVGFRALSAPVQLVKQRQKHHKYAHVAKPHCRRPRYQIHVFWLSLGSSYQAWRCRVSCRASWSSLMAPQTSAAMSKCSSCSQGSGCWCGQGSRAPTSQCSRWALHARQQQQLEVLWSPA